MAVRLFLAVVRLSVTGSALYLMMKLLAAACGDRLSQRWRCRGVMAVSLLFVLPLYKLWRLIPGPRVSLPVFIAAGGNGGPVYLPPSSGAAADVPGGDVMILGAAARAGVDWARVIEWASVLWLAVTAVLILFYLWRLARCRRLLERNSQKANGRLSQIAWEAAGSLGVYKEIRLLISPLARTPVMAGFFRPVIFLPTDLLPEGDAGLILAHELTHFRRGDMWKKLLVSVIRYVHWFNPAVWLLKRDFDFWLETSCDEQVVSALDCARRKEYGRLLIDYAPASRYEGTRLYALFTSYRYKLERRISVMMTSGKRSRSLLGLLLALALLAACLATTALAAEAGTEQTAVTGSDGSIISVDENAAPPVGEDEQTSRMKYDGYTVYVDEAAPLSGGEGQTVAIGSANDTWIAQAVPGGGEKQYPVDDAVANMGAAPKADGELAGSSGYTYGSVAVGAGGTITISVTFGPADATVRIGYVDSNGIATYVDVSGGSGTHTFTVSEAGTYSIYLYNSSMYNVKLSASYIIGRAS